MGLTQQQVNTFREDGVLVAKNVLTDADFAPLIRELEDFIERRANELKAAGKIKDLAAGQPFEKRIATLFAQDESIVTGIDIMHMRGKAAFEFLRNKNLMDAVESLIGGEITCSPIQHLRPKVPSNVGKGNYELVPWHQDSAVTWEEADSADIVTCWIPLVDATKERGCMEVIPGQSNRGYIEHIAEGGTQINPKLMPSDLKPIVAECPKGGVVFMTKLTPHRGLPNVSDCVRWTIDLRYQRTGTPTGRPFYPDFPTRSRLNPESVLTDHAEWCRRWIAGFEEGKNKKWHRTHQPVMAGKM
jgi:phytanoyl-CoA hydroxylase